MYKILTEAHSGLAYLVIIGLLVSTVYYFIQYFSKKNLNASSKKIALITMILVHLQLVLGLALYFVSPVVQDGLKAFGEKMGDPYTRLRMLEHPMVMLIVVVLVTIANKMVKSKSLTNQPVNFIPPLLFLLSLLFVLSRIPWDTWI